MSITAESMTPADIRACTSNNDGNGMWGGDWLAYILLFALIGGGGFGGFGGFGGGGILPWLLFGNGGFGGNNCATQADLAAGFNNSAVLSNLNDLALGQAGIQQTLCNGFNGVNTTVMQGFNGVDNAICNLGYNVQGGFNALQHSLDSCCCTTQRAIDSGKYENATNTCAIQNTIQNTTRDIIDNANANSRAILDFMVQSKLADKDARIATLEGQVARAEQNAFITANQEAQTATLLPRLGRDVPVPAYVVPNPNCCYQYAQPTCGCGGSF